MSKSQSILETVARTVRHDFEEQRRILSFRQFLELFLEHPTRHARNAAQYTRDAFLHFGREKREAVWGEVTHFGLFDAEWENGKERLVGHEPAQARVFRLIEGFIREGRVNKLVLLHGPNGSAKSTFVKAMMRALEQYSRTDEGALYRFNWVFPNERLASGGGSIGFDGFSARAVEDTNLDSFAFLDEDAIDVKLASDLNDHPLLLFPAERRAELLRDAIPGAVAPGWGETDDDKDDDEQLFFLSDYILSGDLSHTSKQIFDALMNAYRGDLEKVLKHVQVERFYVSRRYRVGAVSVEPQMRVDANLRQLTVDRSLSALPSSLQNQTLVEPFGDLVDANRGIIEYDDLFKRHPDLNKYLLATSEKASVSLESRILYLDMLMLGTANEDYLDAFKKTPDYASFKGRVELVRVPYILDYELEQTIYDAPVELMSSERHAAPHVTYVAALWAVLTRLRRPDADRYNSSIRDVVSRLSPLEKADLYARGVVPENTAPDRARELKGVVPELMTEGDGSSEYEGRRGASPREMKMILLNASQNPKFPCLSPLAVLEELEQLVKDPSVFPFLQMKPDGDYHRHDNFIQTVRERYLDLLDDEVSEAMGLVDAQQYEDLFARYVDHVSQRLKGEKVYNSIVGKYEEPDVDFMEEVEEVLIGDEDADVEEFRQGIISSIAAYSIDHPGEKVSYKVVFPNLFSQMRRSFFEERQKTVLKILDNVLQYFDGTAKNLSTAEQSAVDTTLTNLRETYGYCEHCAREAVAFLHSKRYKG
jgi:predicted Ser/Thr protein kinase